jgi:hypothetical protein
MNPGTETNQIEKSTASARRIARPPDARDAIISIRVTDFVAANAKDVGNDGISRFLWKL